MELILIFCLVAWIAFLAASLLALLVCRLRQLGLCGTVDGEFICTKNAVFFSRIFRTLRKFLLLKGNHQSQGGGEALIPTDPKPYQTPGNQRPVGAMVLGPLAFSIAQCIVNHEDPTTRKGPPQGVGLSIRMGDPCHEYKAGLVTIAKLPLFYFNAWRSILPSKRRLYCVRN